MISVWGSGGFIAVGHYSRGSGWREWVAGGRKVGGATKLEGLLQKSILKEVGGEGGRRGEKGEEAPW